MNGSQRGIRVRGLRKSFRSFRRTQEVLRGIDFDIAPGEVVGLIGPNGAGKTTLMSCLLGFLETDDGAISIDGMASDDLEVRRRTGFVPERMNLGRRPTGWEFLHYMALLSGVPAAEVKTRGVALMERLGIAAAMNQRLREYSRGMLQRLALCQALIHQPLYVFLDEPASGLDPNGVLLVRDLILEQKNRGAAVLLNSHQLSEVEKVCDRVLFLRDGVIGREETLRDLSRVTVAVRMLPGYDPALVSRLTASVPKDDVVIVSAATEADIAFIIRSLVTSGIDVVQVQPHRADLEGMFRSRT